MKKVKSLIMAIVVLTMTISLVACGGAGSSTEESASSGGESTSNGGAGESGIIQIGQTTDITSLYPQGHNATATGNVTRMLYDCLVRLDEDGQTFVPMLAESWEWLDATTIQFKLREGVKFHNGDEMTADDVAYTIEFMRESGYSQHLIEMVTETEIVDDYTIKFYTTEENAALLSSLAHQCSGVVNKEYTENLLAEGKTLDDEPCGTGPYYFDYWNAGSDCQVLKFDDYYDSDYMAKNDGLRFVYYPEASSAVIALESGDIDVLLDVPSTSIEEIKSNSSVKLLEYDSTQLTYMALNCGEGSKFEDVRVREAVAYAINRDNLITVCCEGYGTPNYSPLGIAAIGYTEVENKHEYDIDKAKELLAEAGAEDLSFTIWCYPALQGAAQVVQDNCRAAGITVDIQVYEEAQLTALSADGEFDAAMGFWFANAEPDNSYRPLFHSDNYQSGAYNWINVADEELDTLIDSALKVTDADERMAIYEDVNNYISDNVYWIPMYSQTGFVATGADVDGIVLYAIQMPLFQGITK